MVESVQTRRRAAATAVLSMMTLAPLVGIPPAAAAQEPPPELQPVQIVVLVDQSGSLSNEDIEREIEAARVIVQGEPSEESTVSVVGFGSADAPGQSPIDVVCPPTKLDTPQNRQFLADCVDELDRRAKSEGDGTDHVTALRTALSYLGAPEAADQPKIVYLLTDGRLDVSGSPAFGNNAEDRDAAARQQIPGLLNELSLTGISVWPLGFGQVDRRQLEGFASGAAQAPCGVRTPRPSATVITGSAELMKAITAASGAARCASVGEPASGELPGGGSLDLTVHVPAVASEGTIVVYKRDPRVTVSYLDAEGAVVPVNGRRGVSRFSLSGQGSKAEALRIVNPLPGAWTVRLSAPSGDPARNVSAVAIFQGAVRAVISVAPPAPRPGAPVEVTMQVRGTRGAITDPAALRGLAFTAELSGDGFAGVPPVELGDGDGDGQYQGSLTVPSSATGRLEFLGSVSGIGVSGDRRPYPTRISGAAADVAGVLTLDGEGGDVVVGSTLHGTANVSNSTGQPRTVRLEVVDQSSGAVVSADPATLNVPASGSKVLDFTVSFDKATALGPNQARLRLVDTADGALVGELLFARQIVPEPGPIDRFIEEYWWLLVLLGIALAGGVATVLWRKRRARREGDVRGVQVELRRHEQYLSARKALHKGEEFRFVVRHGADPCLAVDGDGDPYVVRRGSGGPTLHVPSGAALVLTEGGVFDLGDGLELVVHDRTSGQVASVRPSLVGVGPGRADAGDPYLDEAPADRSNTEEDPYDPA